MPVSHPVFDDLDYSSEEERVIHLEPPLYLPLKHITGDFNHSVTDDDHDRKELRLYGYLLLVSAWIITVGSIGCIFNLWGWVFKDIDFVKWFKSMNNPTLSFVVDSIIEQDYVISNYYVCFLFLNFVVLWIWSVASWISMKLFRHSKGGGS